MTLFSSESQHRLPQWRYGRGAFAAALLLTFCSLGIFGGAAVAQDTIWSSTATPQIASANDPYAYELGVKFTSDVDGTVTGIRFYKGAGNTGKHIGHLWTASGGLLASVTFSNETASGWQQANLSAPVSISANTVYVVSYWDPNGCYSLSRPYFSSAENNGPLHALASGTDGPNGVFLYNASAFPTESYDDSMSNYWVDVVFTPAESGSAGPVQTAGTTIWSSSATPQIASANDPYAYELGVKFTSDVDGYITAIRFYKGALNTGTHVGHIWNANGALLATAIFNNETASGWQQADLPSPLAIAANTVYIASYWDPNGYYSLSRPYFSSAENNGPLHALASGTDGPNGVFLYNASAFPTESYDDSMSNYWVDVVFTPSSAGTAGGGSSNSSGSANAQTAENGGSQLLLGISPSILSFGNVATGASSVLPLLLSDQGSSPLTISQISSAGAGFTVSAPVLPMTLTAGQSVSISITFAPGTAGSASGSVSIVSNAVNSPAMASLDGVAVGQHSVTLSWTASISPGISGYNVYRADGSAGSYTKLNSSVVGSTTYTDDTVSSGQTYEYVLTSVDSDGTESAYSSPAQAVIPFP